MLFSFTVSAVFSSAKDAAVVSAALTPELNQKHERNSKTTMGLSENVLSIEIFSPEEKSLKASVNSYLKLLDLSVKSLEVY